MVEEAEEHSAEDEKRREEIEARNQADSLVYTTGKTLKEHGDSLDAGERSNIESAIEKLKETLKSGGAEEIKRDMDALQQASYKLAEKMYAGARGGATGAAGGWHRGQLSQVAGEKRYGPCVERHPAATIHAFNLARDLVGGCHVSSFLSYIQEVAKNAQVIA